METALGILIALVPVLAQIVTAILDGRMRARKETDALTLRSIDELSVGADRVRQQPPL